METDLFTIVFRLMIAVVAGGIIGLERSLNGRPAGFRTHSLVCSSSAMLMLLTVYQWELLASAPLDTIRVDPTRMAQGIMTGIGFLGAGAIIKDQITIRGLTTAASIWVTSSIGILIGMGFYEAVIPAMIFTLGTLSAFRMIERRIPTLRYGTLSISTLHKSSISDEDIVNMVKQHKFTPSNMSYFAFDQGKYLRYEMTICTREEDNFKKLANTIAQLEDVTEFSLISSAS